jgi:hypothetical protein
MARPAKAAATDDGPRELAGKRVIIHNPKIVQVTVAIRGTSPLVISAFNIKAQEQMLGSMTRDPGESRKGKNAKRPPKQLFSEWRDKLYTAKTINPDTGEEETWYGLNASAFRNAMIDCCRTAGFEMTKAKLCIFTDADGYDMHTQTPLVRIYGTPHSFESYARNADLSIDLRGRPMWDIWAMKLKLRYDADIFDFQSVYALLMRAGLTNGVGEGRANSKKSAGMGFGFFEIIPTDEIESTFATLESNLIPEIESVPAGPAVMDNA